MRRAIVTGGLGFVGGYLIEALGQVEVQAQPFDIKVGDDVRDYEHVRTEVDSADPDYVFHLAAQAYVPESSLDVERALDVNVRGTLNVLRAVRNTGSHARVLIAGTSEEYGYATQPATSISEDSPTRPTTEYGWSKLAASELALTYGRRYGIPVIVTRAWNHTGPGASPSYAVSAFARRVARAERYGEVVVHGNLDAVRSYLDVRDVVRAYVGLRDVGSGVYNVANEVPVKMQTIMDELVRLADTEVETRLNDSLYREAPGAFPTPSCGRIRRLIGWEPEIPLRRTLEEMLDHWRKRV